MYLKWFVLQEEVSNSIEFMGVTGNFDRFKRGHKLVGHEVKSMSENKWKTVVASSESMLQPL